MRDFLLEKRHWIDSSVRIILTNLLVDEIFDRLRFFGIVKKTLPRTVCLNTLSSADRKNTEKLCQTTLYGLRTMKLRIPWSILRTLKICKYFIHWDSYIQLDIIESRLMYRYSHWVPFLIWRFRFHRHGLRVILFLIVCCCIEVSTSTVDTIRNHTV